MSASALLCASAFAPLLAVGGLGGEALGILGSMGGNILSGVLADAITRLGGRDVGMVEAARLLAEEIRRELGTGEPRAQQLTEELTLALAEGGALERMLRTAFGAAEQAVQDRILDDLRCLRIDLYHDLQVEFGAIESQLHEVWQDFHDAAAVDRQRQDAISRQTSEIRALQDLIMRSMAPERRLPALWSGGCPYPGLRPYTEEHARVFYSEQRDALVSYVERVRWLDDRFQGGQPDGSRGACASADYPTMGQPMTWSSWRLRRTALS
ncbi:hypothetical protein J5X84_44285, partial [Streptosporangiaceae bacterium NEAU-GS5]|nr:hypothetical protein [Streptosporangiaceae bacterium NEAU-GS5]